MTLLLPLYVHPAEDPAAWRAAPLRNAGATVVVNVHNGPGADGDPYYPEVVRRLADAGVPLLGYVDLAYGARRPEEVAADVDGWRRYPVGGVFFDQAPADLAGLPAVTAAVAHCPGRIVLNPGTPPHPAYAPLADLVCTFEGPWPAYRDRAADPGWPHAVHLVYGVPAGLLGEAAVLLSRRCAGGLVSDLRAPHPYLGVPTWLAARAEAVP
ncbi:MAG: hypothetical protein HOV79_04515 [Hamadaea sp.]|nr:hypothetical protein [Hamadaea sp.]